MNSALILGCSHAAGTEMYKELVPAISAQKDQDDYGYLNSYPVVISQRLGYRPLNHSAAAGSNDGMYRIWNSYISQGLLTINDIVIACWTSDVRSEFYHAEEQQWLNLGPGVSDYWTKSADDIILDGRPNYHTKVKNHNEYRKYLEYWTIYRTDNITSGLNRNKNIAALNSEAQGLGIKVINIYSLPGYKNVSIPTRQFWPVGDQDFMSWSQEKGYQYTKWHHYYSDAHKAFAEHVLAHV